MNNMTLDEAIRHCEEVAEENQAIVDACDYYGDNMAKCDKCANEHRQLAEWLKDYKRLLKENEKNTGKDIATAFQFGMALGFAKKCDECEERKMTREELRDYVDEQRTLNNIPYYVYSALIDGIDTLEQKPGEDAISRQAAIDAFGKFIHELGIKDEPYNYGEMALSAKNVPPVTPQPKIGHWIWVTEDIYKCSECYEDIRVKEVMNVPQYEWCPLCGTKMVEQKESEK